MRAIDYWVGIPLCAVATIIYKIFFTKVAPTSPRKILMMEFSEMGSAILAHSSIAHLQNTQKDAQIYFLTFKKNRESVDILGCVPHDRVLTVDESSFLAFFLSTFNALRACHRLKIDTVIDLELFSRYSALFSFLTFAKQRVGFDNHTNEGLYRGNFITHRVLYNPHRHMALNFLSLTDALKSTPQDFPYIKEDLRNHIVPLPQFVASREDESAIIALLNSSFPDSDPSGLKLVLLNPDPGEDIPLRGWPIENYCLLAKLLLNYDSSIRIGILGLARSHSFAREICEYTKDSRCVDFTAQTPRLSLLTTLFNRSALLITNDSGPAHFAALTSIHSIVLFGPESPGLYRPLTSRLSELYLHLACSPCLTAANHRLSRCTSNACLRGISANVVAEEAMKVLRKM